MVLLGWCFFAVGVVDLLVFLFVVDVVVDFLVFIMSGACFCWCCLLFLALFIFVYWLLSSVVGVVGVVVLAFCCC